MAHLDVPGRSVDAMQSPACRAALETDILPAYVSAQRWFASKGEAGQRFRIKDSVPFAADARSLLLIIEVTPAAGAAAQYQFPVTLLWEAPPDDRGIIAEVRAGDARGWLVDAYADDTFVHRLVRFAPPSSGSGRVGFRATASFAPSAFTDAAISRPGAEQSNTSIRIGPAILKAYRRLAPGVHPEQEIGAFLTERRFAGVPALLGTLELAGEGQPPIVLGIMQSLVADAADGWSYVTDRLPRIGSGDKAAAAELQRVADRLGACTAGLHRALADGAAHPDFAPAPVSDHWLTEWADEIAASAVAIFPRLQRPSGSERRALPVDLHQVKACIASATAAAAGFSATRVHGDYHLGQVLVSGDEIFIVDFEGEPMRPLAVRRQKGAPLRDVAGMLRSFDYALAIQQADGEATPAAGSAIADAKRRFLQGYKASIAGAAGFPGNLDDANKILLLGLLEKTLYEIGYELDNRPDWVGIPLRGLRDIIVAPEAYRFVP